MKSVWEIDIKHEYNEICLNCDFRLGSHSFVRSACPNFYNKDLFKDSQSTFKSSNKYMCINCESRKYPQLRILR